MTIRPLLPLTAGLYRTQNGLRAEIISQAVGVDGPLWWNGRLMGLGGMYPTVWNLDGTHREYTAWDLVARVEE